MCMASGPGGRDYSSLKGAKIGFASQSGESRFAAQSRSGGSLLGGTTKSTIGFASQSGESRFAAQSRSGAPLLSGTTSSTIGFARQSGDGNTLLTGPRLKTVQGP